MVRATKGKKLTQAGRSTSDSMLDLLKRGKTKDDDSTTNKKSKPKKPEFHIPTSNHGKSKHFGIREEHITELAEEKRKLETTLLFYFVSNYLCTHYDTVHGPSRQFGSSSLCMCFEAIESEDDS